MVFVRLIVPDDLGARSLGAGTRGWFHGSVIGSEYLAVARASQVGAEELTVPASRGLFDHWSFMHGALTQKLVTWVAVHQGFGVALQDNSISESNLSRWIVDGQAVAIPDETVPMLCCIEASGDQSATVHLILVTSDRIIPGEVVSVAAEPQLSARVGGLAPTLALYEKRVAIVGVGSGGSMVAVNLAAAGVGTLHLFDKDTLSKDNVFRHACDAHHLGRAKVLAVRDLIRGYDLPSKVIAHEQDVVTDAQDLWEVMDEIDLVLCATDNIPSRRLTNYVAVRTGTPLVMACTFQNAGIGEIIRVIPGTSACYECTRIALSKAGTLEQLSESEQSGVYVPYESEDNNRTDDGTDRGSRADVAIVAGLQSRVAITTLLSGVSIADSLPRNYLTWGGRIQTTFPDPFYFGRPFSTTWVDMTREDACPVCRDIGSQVDKESDRAFQEIMEGLKETSE